MKHAYKWKYIYTFIRHHHYHLKISEQFNNPLKQGRICYQISLYYLVEHVAKYSLNILLHHLLWKGWVLLKQGRICCQISLYHLVEHVVKYSLKILLHHLLWKGWVVKNAMMVWLVSIILNDLMHMKSRVMMVWLDFIFFFFEVTRTHSSWYNCK